MEGEGVRSHSTLRIIDYKDPYRFESLLRKFKHPLDYKYPSSIIMAK